MWVNNGSKCGCMLQTERFRSSAVLYYLSFSENKTVLVTVMRCACNHRSFGSDRVLFPAVSHENWAVTNADCRFSLPVTFQEGNTRWEFPFQWPWLGHLNNRRAMHPLCLRFRGKCSVSHDSQFPFHCRFDTNLVVESALETIWR